MSVNSTEVEKEEKKDFENGVEKWFVRKTKSHIEWQSLYEAERIFKLEYINIDRVLGERMSKHYSNDNSFNGLIVCPSGQRKRGKEGRRAWAEDHFGKGYRF